jgi:hypothetical protein
VIHPNGGWWQSRKMRANEMASMQNESGLNFVWNKIFLKTQFCFYHFTKRAFKSYLLRSNKSFDKMIFKIFVNIGLGCVEEKVWPVNEIVMTKVMLYETVLAGEVDSMMISRWSG